MPVHSSVMQNARLFLVRGDDQALNALDLRQNLFSQDNILILYSICCDPTTLPDRSHRHNSEVL